MPTAMATNDRIVLRMICKHCGGVTEKALSVLLGPTEIVCKTPDCGKEIDLSSDDNGKLIDAVSKISLS
jgi:hypothetical protein